MEEKYVSIADAARELGLSPRQVHRRLTLVRQHLDGQLDGHLRRGPRGAWLLDRALLELLKRVENYRQSTGVVLSEALAEALEKTFPENQDGESTLDRQTTGNLPVDYKHLTGSFPVDDLVREVEGIRQELRWMTGLLLVESLLLGVLIWLVLRQAV